jgi:hypothetical protein
MGIAEAIAQYRWAAGVIQRLRRFSSAQLDFGRFKRRRRARFRRAAKCAAEFLCCLGAALDPMQAIRLVKVGHICSMRDWVPIEEYREGRFYREWVRPQRFEDAASVLLDSCADGFSYFG